MWKHLRFAMASEVDRGGTVSFSSIAGVGSIPIGHKSMRACASLGTCQAVRYQARENTSSEQGNEPQSIDRD